MYTRHNTYTCELHTMLTDIDSHTMLSGLEYCLEIT